ncbi:MAG: hypothetical protein Q9168_005796 [Polycauliona sp. 1 TL-2023]
MQELGHGKDVSAETSKEGTTSQSGALTHTPSDESEDSEDEDFETYQDESYAATALENGNRIIDRLYQLSFKIRNPATRSGFTKAQRIQAIDEETGVDLIQIYASFDHQHLEHVFLGFREGISTADIRGHYFVQRLAKANTRRRQQFRYWKSHRNKIEASSEPKKDIELLIPTSKVLELDQRQLLGEAPILAQPAPSMPSTATRLDPNVVKFDDAASIMSTSTSAKLTKGPEASLEIPQFPKKLRGKKEFECPYCYVLCSAKTGSAPHWSQHVLCDLRPYICTYENCKDADQQYDSFHQWVAHEANNHTLVRRCSEHLGETFRSLAGWREHIATHHLDTPITNHLEIIADNLDPGDKLRDCPICTAEAVTSEHVGVHLQQLALFALPRSTGLEEDLDSDDDASVAAAEDVVRDDKDSDVRSLPKEDGRPPDAVYGVDYNWVGNMLAYLDPYELAPTNRHIEDDWSIVFNPVLPRQFDIRLFRTITFKTSIWVVRFSPNGQYVAVAMEVFAAIYEVATGSKIADFKHGSKYSRTLCFDSLGEHLIVVAGEKSSVIKVRSASPFLAESPI